ncbi:MAG: hypothetical protein AAB279_00215, partial [Candidatus Binatota bacterium]
FPSRSNRGVARKPARPIVLIFAATSVGLARTNLLHHRVLDDGPFRPVSVVVERLVWITEKRGGTTR